ncbi:HPE1 family effector [Candidatus Liberibacter solanacearum]|uniref:Uncharacterized protein n=1 Tax=Candidatus Liberibacter solanacearum TaxID=556287 RepID=A0A1V2N734_9HYPH|nr:HPE1 family effector [Candidatus Liberibacter solanacearum]ONI58619.1 hypothetical protein AYO25_04905 [Candidatus Liberibacter solanacearum]ONI59537.1 hypothetical protein AYJ09_04340 [Candidatus Liberibacter solanacearum]
MNFLMLAVILFAFSAQVGKAQSVYEIHHPIKTQDSVIYVESPSYELPKQSKSNIQNQLNNVISIQKEVIIDGKNAMLMTDNLMGNEPETFIKHFTHEEQKEQPTKQLQHSSR